MTTDIQEMLERACKRPKAFQFINWKQASAELVAANLDPQDIYVREAYMVWFERARYQAEQLNESRFATYQGDAS